MGMKDRGGVYLGKQICSKRTFHNAFMKYSHLFNTDRLIMRLVTNVIQVLGRVLALGQQIGGTLLSVGRIMHSRSRVDGWVNKMQHAQ